MNSSLSADFAATGSGYSKGTFVLYISYHIAVSGCKTLRKSQGNGPLLRSGTDNLQLPYHIHVPQLPSRVLAPFHIGFRSFLHDSHIQQPMSCIGNRINDIYIIALLRS
jgi:hypothetical protein